MENETMRVELLKQADQAPALKKKAEKAKVAWKKALAEEKAHQEALKGKVRSARKAMDAAYNNLSAATQAKNTLRAEFTPKEIQKKELALGLIYRTHKQQRERAEGDVARFKQGLEARARRKGFTPDVDTAKRDADRLVNLESIAANVAEKEEAAQKRWEAVQKELDDAYGQATRQTAS